MLYYVLERDHCFTNFKILQLQLLWSFFSLLYQRELEKNQNHTEWHLWPAIPPHSAVHAFPFSSISYLLFFPQTSHFLSSSHSHLETLHLHWDIRSSQKQWEHVCTAATHLSVCGLPSLFPWVSVRPMFPWAASLCLLTYSRVLLQQLSCLLYQFLLLVLSCQPTKYAASSSTFLKKTCWAHNSPHYCSMTWFLFIFLRVSLLAVFTSFFPSILNSLQWTSSSLCCCKKSHRGHSKPLYIAKSNDQFSVQCFLSTSYIFSLSFWKDPSLGSQSAVLFWFSSYLTGTSSVSFTDFLLPSPTFKYWHTRGIRLTMTLNLYFHLWSPDLHIQLPVWHCCISIH